MKNVSLALFFIYFPHMAHAKLCSQLYVEKICPSLAKAKKEAKLFFRTEDGSARLLIMDINTLDPNVPAEKKKLTTLNLQLVKIAEEPLRKKQLTDTFEKAKKFSLTFFLSGRPLESLPKEEQKIYQTIKTSKLKILKKGNEYYEECLLVPTQSMTDTETGVVYSCDTLGATNPMNIARTLSHELGHLFGPCENAAKVKLLTKAAPPLSQSGSSSGQPKETAATTANQGFRSTRFGALWACFDNTASRSIVQNQNSPASTNRQCSQDPDRFNGRVPNAFTEQFSDIVAGNFLGQMNLTDQLPFFDAEADTACLQHTTQEIMLIGQYPAPLDRVSIFLSSEKIKNKFGCEYDQSIKCSEDPASVPSATAQPTSGQPTGASPNTTGKEMSDQ